MYTLSSYIISHYTGSYTSFVKDRIFTPLNMTSTTFSLSEAMRSGEMTDAWANSGRRIPQWLTDEQIDLIAGPGGIISSGEDMVRGTFFVDC
jgi:CubicO group peptidase (beta-lactamase class C family)